MQAIRDWDLSLFRSINIGLHRDWLDPYFTFLSYSGLGASQAIACLLLLSWKPTRWLAWPLGMSSAVAGFIFADGIKRLIPRERPSNLTWAIVQEPVKFQSFPSGHSASSFGFAAMLMFLVYRTEYRWVGWLGLCWASLVALSRIYRGVHWPSDVIGGALCGFLGAAIVYVIFDKQGWLPQWETPQDENQPEDSSEG